MDVLQKLEREKSFADEALDRFLHHAKLDYRDRALVVELVYGVLRHRSTLDWRLAQIADRPFDRLPVSVRTALRLGAYQLLYLERIPASAAVNESVSLIKRSAGHYWAGFVNAVLRGLERASAPSWPDPAEDPTLAYAVRYGCPLWLAKRWIDHFGAERAASLCRATVAIPPLTLRVNTLRITRKALSLEFQKAGYEARSTEISPVGLLVEKCGPVIDLPLFEEGAFYVEDEAAQLIPPILDPQPGERVLDACAAPGGKTTHLAALMRNQGEIVAMDRHPHRLGRLEDNCRRLGIDIVTAIQADAAQDLLSHRLNALRRPFDRVLLDAPCSGLGVLRRHPEGKWHKTEAMLPQHAATQIGLLDRVSRLLRPGGVLVYSTCSTEAEENEHVIAQFLRHHPAFSRESVVPWLPQSGRVLTNSEGDYSTVFSRYDMDGFFAARLRKDS
ncbi:MAG: 16S rRNA (cytosine(967)-C(5))-methyltransferase RsmB [Nitrospiraceae bacterium]|nr:16S rRNA (cytosine(967)-C(5))-methyltransferase RsmB [Nitrospiraceae bacterium]